MNTDLETLSVLRNHVASLPPLDRRNVETITTALRELVARHGNTAKIALIVYSAELLLEEDSPDDQPSPLLAMPTPQSDKRIAALSTALRDALNLFNAADKSPDGKSPICTGDRREMWEAVLKRFGDPVPPV